MLKKYFLILILFTSSILTAGIPMNQEYHGPTEQLIKRESWGKIQTGLKKKKVPLELVPFFDDIAKTEDWGHIGYHGANQGFRVYQDVIRITIEEVLGIPIREDFHFLRVPGDADLKLNSYQEFYKYYRKDGIDNKNKTRAKQLLSLNYGIYSNYNSKNSCSLVFFVKDKSKTSINYSKHLNSFYQDLGISSKELESLFAIGHKWFDEENGILIKISENSHLNNQEQFAYNFADEQCYPAKPQGYLYGRYPISNHYERILTDLYIAHKLDCSPQLRLILNNRNTLNPYSNLIIKRYSLYDEKINLAYENELREAIKKLRSDPKKVELYKQKLFKLWL